MPSINLSGIVGYDLFFLFFFLFFFLSFLGGGGETIYSTRAELSIRSRGARTHVNAYFHRRQLLVCPKILNGFRRCNLDWRIVRVFFFFFFFSLVTVCAKRALWGNCDWFDDKGKLLSVDRNVCRMQEVFSIFFTYVINLHNFYAKIRMSKGNEFSFRRTYSFYVDQVFESFHQFNK